MTDPDSSSRRFHEATGYIGHDTPQVRLAGVHAFARLADDWPEQRQSCVDILCGYLRMPSTAPEERSQRSESLVRAAICQTIAEHVRTEANPSWSALKFDLRGATLDSLRIINARFDLEPDFSDVKFLGWITFQNVTFQRGARFDGAVITSVLDLSGCSVESQRLSVDRVRVSKDARIQCDVRVNGKDTSLSFSMSQVDGNIQITIQEYDTEQGRILVDTVEVSETGGVEFLDLIGPGDFGIPALPGSPSPGQPGFLPVVYVRNTLAAPGTGVQMSDELLAKLSAVQ